MYVIAPKFSSFLFFFSPVELFPSSSKRGRENNNAQWILCGVFERRRRHYHKIVMQVFTCSGAGQFFWNHHRHQEGKKRRNELAFAFADTYIHPMPSQSYCFHTYFVSWLLFFIGAAANERSKEKRKNTNWFLFRLSTITTKQTADRSSSTVVQL